MEKGNPKPIYKFPSPSEIGAIKEHQDKALYNFEKLGYRYLNLEQLKDQLPNEKTGNELFDEFWYKWYEV